MGDHNDTVLRKVGFFLPAFILDHEVNGFPLPHTPVTMDYLATSPHARVSADQTRSQNKVDFFSSILLWERKLTWAEDV